MAREISVIETQITDQVAADPVLSLNLTSTSKRAIWRLWAFVVATAIAILEQLMDQNKIEVETLVSQAAPGTPQWLQAQVFKFQYSSTVPQVIQLINLAPQYPTVDPSLRIVTRCSVTTDLANIVTIKTAKNEPPEALVSLELDALASYIRQMGVAGIQYNVVSLAADRLYVGAQVYYTGLFSSVIKTNVILAIDNYLAGIPFNGQIKVSELEEAILDVDGVNDVILQNVVARAESTAFGSGTALVNGNTLSSRLWPTLAGYAISEDTAGQTLADSLTFISQ
jgi:hypothetical protein